jgi:hypothetical protein
LLPVPYYHVVFTLPARIADIAYQNKGVIYDLLFKASSETMLTIAGSMADITFNWSRLTCPAQSYNNAVRLRPYQTAVKTSIQSVVEAV